MILVVDKIGEEVDDDCIPPGFEDIDDCFAKVDNVLDMDVVKALERLQLSMDRLCSPITYSGTTSSDSGFNGAKPTTSSAGCSTRSFVSQRR